MTHGDREAMNLLAERVLPLLRRLLRRTFPRVPHDFVEESIADAVVDYARRPELFDPARGVPLERFLRHIATRNLQDHLRADARRRAREAEYADQMLLIGASRVEPLDTAENGDAMRHILGECDVAEREAARCWLSGERSTHVLAAALGLLHLPTPDQRREVKRFKDRMMKRLIRRAARVPARVASVQ